ncbi:KTSC domain-containing protein [Akkermansiaceae bacterium]|nr:KTSC domain-containing protein [Akkermansiaceae bacterium]MDB4791573.1 KTSC domain-containing protein [Akkermansiaceae bacterium]
MTLYQALIILKIDDEEVSLSRVKFGYRGQMKKWHPDLFGDEKSISEATEKCQGINNAYSILTEHIEDHGPIRNRVTVDKTKERSPQYRYESKPFTTGFPDASVFEVFMKSSNVLSAGYNDTKNTLYIKFKSNDVYEYSNVKPEVWERFQAAESHGKFGNKYIFRAYKYRKCSEPNQPYMAASTISRRCGYLK